MSPLSLSAASSSPAFQSNQTRQRVRFGAGNGKEAAKDAATETKVSEKGQDTAEISKSRKSPQVNEVKDEKTGEQRQAGQPKEASSKPGLLSRLKARFGQFFHYIGKAFKKLFGPQEAKTELEKELKQFKHSMKPAQVYADFKARAKAIQEHGTKAEKKAAAPLLELAKNDADLKKHIYENIQQIQEPYTLGIHLLNNPAELPNTVTKIFESFDTLPQEGQESKAKPANNK